jgi:tRNA threonylcarbamoyl adenosine modification protein YjeE
MKKYIINSEQETIRLAEQVAPLVKKGDILALYGNLGSGKTFFTRSLCGALGSNDHVTSPSFVLINQYDAPDKRINHIDLYRLHTEEDLVGLGLEEFLESGITIIEWPELAERLLKGRVIRFKFVYGKGERSVSIEADTDFLSQID